MAIDNVKENAKSLITELFPTQFTTYIWTGYKSPMNLSIMSPYLLSNI